MHLIRTLVTGAGSGVGQGIIKALRISDLPVRIISSDIAPLNAALFRSDESVILPKVEDAGSLSHIISFLADRNIDVVMIGSEFDLEFFSENKDEIEQKSGALVIVAPLKTVRIANDKWLTANFLKEQNLPYAESYLPSSLNDALGKAEEWGYPVMLKTRLGTSSRHVHVATSSKTILNTYPTIPNPMLQKTISIPETRLAQEYTCSVFKCCDESLLGPFTARRTLRGGSSWIIEVGCFSFLHQLLLAIGKRLPFIGSLNIQLMLGPNGPVPFEFNARFSGTTAIRAHFGFNEPEMTLRNYYLHEPIRFASIGKGLALRYLEEIFLDNILSNEINTQNFPKGEIRQWF